MDIVQEPFGRLATGVEIERYTLSNSRGVKASILTYGCTITSLLTPDSEGGLANVVLGYDTLEEYCSNTAYLCALVGRCANRIARGRFSLAGRQIQLATNNGPNALHGGLCGFDKVVWKPRALQTGRGSVLRFDHVSPAGDQGYPGTLTVSADYLLTDADSLRIDLTAATDADTIVNMTQHTYFNLRGHGDILGHVLKINAEYFAPTDATQVPTGELRAVAATPFDFRRPTPIGLRIDASDDQLRIARGYDHNWVVSQPQGQLGVMASLTDPESGRVVEIAANTPGIQVYSGNLLDQAAQSHRGGVALEPQHFPDSPNHSNFPSIVLERGHVYHHTIEYRFSQATGAA